MCQHPLSMEPENDVKAEQGGSNISSPRLSFADNNENIDHEQHRSETPELDNVSNNSSRSFDETSNGNESKCNNEERGEKSDGECSENGSDNEMRIDETVEEDIGSSVENNQDDFSDRASQGGDKHSVEEEVEEEADSLEENPPTRRKVEDCSTGENQEDITECKSLDNQQNVGNVVEDDVIKGSSHGIGHEDQQQLDDEEGTVDDDALDLNDRNQNLNEQDVSDEEMETEIAEEENMMNEEMKDILKTNDQAENIGDVAHEKQTDSCVESDGEVSGDDIEDVSHEKRIGSCVESDGEVSRDSIEDVLHGKQTGSYVESDGEVSGDGMEDVSDEEGDSDGSDGKQKAQEYNIDSGREDISEEEQEELFGETSNADFNKLDLCEERKTMNETTKQNGNTSEAEKVKSQTSFTEDHVELDYEEDVIDENKAHDDSKEKLDDSREEGECPDVGFQLFTLHNIVIVYWLTLNGSRMEGQCPDVDFHML